MKTLTRVATACLTVLGLTAMASVNAQTPAAADTKAAVRVAPGAAAAATTIKTTAIVVSVDSATRVVTLRRQDGKIISFTAGEQVRNFDQLRVGDTVAAEYAAAVSLELKKGGKGVPQASDKQAMDRAPAGAKPGGIAGRKVTVLADVVAVDEKKQVVTLRGPAGNVVDLVVQDPAQMKNLKKGDQVEAVYAEALAISIEAAAPPSKK
jgi:Cu/Ag efflux protein CusF